MLINQFFHLKTDRIISSFCALVSSARMSVSVLSTTSTFASSQPSLMSGFVDPVGAEEAWFEPASGVGASSFELMLSFNGLKLADFFKKEKFCSFKEENNNSMKFVDLSNKLSNF